MTVETDPSAWASQQPAAWFCRLHAQRCWVRAQWGRRRVIGRGGRAADLRPSKSTAADGKPPKFDLLSTTPCLGVCRSLRAMLNLVYRRNQYPHCLAPPAPSDAASLARLNHDAAEGATTRPVALSVLHYSTHSFARR
jgi:hypothetical protein